jgi:GNAT superfamily N-acetyltransferase
LSGSLARGARCYIARWRGEPVAFAATLPIYGKKAHWRFTRIVTLPDYQGAGIGMALVETVADLHREAGNRINVTTSHPAMIAHCRQSQRWRCVTVKKHGAIQSPRDGRPIKGSHGRAVVSFEYVDVTQ